MKVLKKAKIVPCKCQYCHSVFQPKWRNLGKSSRFVKEEVQCPVCKGTNYVKFVEREGDNG